MAERSSRAGGGQRRKALLVAWQAAAAEGRARHACKAAQVASRVSCGDPENDGVSRAEASGPRDSQQAHWHLYFPILLQRRTQSHWASGRTFRNRAASIVDRHGDTPRLSIHLTPARPPSGDRRGWSFLNRAGRLRATRARRPLMQDRAAPPTSHHGRGSFVAWVKRPLPEYWHTSPHRASGPPPASASGGSKQALSALRRGARMSARLLAVL